jgi:hypothetical protein
MGLAGSYPVVMLEQTVLRTEVSMFNAYSLRDHPLKVSAAKPREPRGAISLIIES